MSSSVILWVVLWGYPHPGLLLRFSPLDGPLGLSSRVVLLGVVLLWLFSGAIPRIVPQVFSSGLSSLVSFGVVLWGSSGVHL